MRVAQWDYLVGVGVDPQDLQRLKGQLSALAQEATRASVAASQSATGGRRGGASRSSEMEQEQTNLRKVVADRGRLLQEYALQGKRDLALEQEQTRDLSKLSELRKRLALNEQETGKIRDRAVQEDAKRTRQRGVQESQALQMDEDVAKRRAESARRQGLQETAALKTDEELTRKRGLQETTARKMDEESARKRGLQQVQALQMDESRTRSMYQAETEAYKQAEIIKARERSDIQNRGRQQEQALQMDQERTRKRALQETEAQVEDRLRSSPQYIQAKLTKELMATAGPTGIPQTPENVERMRQLAEVNRSLAQTRGQLAEVNRSLAQTRGQLALLGEEAPRARSALGSFFGDLGHNVLKVAEWTVATGLLYGSFAGLRSGIQVLTEIDYALTNLQKVYHGVGVSTAADMQTMKAGALTLGQTYGANIKDVINSMTNWARLGYNSHEIIELTRASLLAQNIAELDAVEATKYLTAAMMQFNLPASKAISILDSWNELSNRYAATAKDIAEGVSRIGKTAADAGVTIQQVDAMIAVLVQSTKRSGSEIGTALRTIFTYAYRDKNAKLLQEIGIFVHREGDKLLPVMDILGQLSVRWDRLAPGLQQKIAEAFGVRRITEFRTLLESMPDIMHATTIAYASLGSSERENAIFMDSLQVKYKQFQASLQALAQSTELQSLLKAIVSDMTSVAQWMAKGHLETLGWVAGIGAAALAIPAVIKEINALKLALIGLNITSEGAGIAGMLGALANPIVLAALAALVAVGGVVAVGKITDYQNYGKYQSKVTQLQAATQQYQSTETIRADAMAAEAENKHWQAVKGKDEIRFLQKQYEELTKGGTLRVAGDQLVKLDKVLGNLRTATGNVSLVIKDGLYPSISSIQGACTLAINGLSSLDKEATRIALKGLDLRAEIAHNVAQGQQSALDQQTRALTGLEKEADRKRLQDFPWGEGRGNTGETPDQARRKIANRVGGYLPVPENFEQIAGSLEKKGMKAIEARLQAEKIIGEKVMQAYRERSETEGKKKAAELEESTSKDLAKKVRSGKTPPFPEEPTPQVGAGVPTPEKGKKGPKPLELERQVRGVLREAATTQREMRQMLERTSNEDLPQWMQNVVKMGQSWEDMADRATDSIQRIDDSLSHTKAGSAADVALRAQRKALADQAASFAIEEPHAVLREWERVSALMVGGLLGENRDYELKRKALIAQINLAKEGAGSPATLKAIEDAGNLALLEQAQQHLIRIKDIEKERLDIADRLHRATMSQAAYEWSDTRANDLQKRIELTKSAQQSAATYMRVQRDTRLSGMGPFSEEALKAITTADLAFKQAEADYYEAVDAGDSYARAFRDQITDMQKSMAEMVGDTTAQVQLSLLKYQRAMNPVERFSAMLEVTQLYRSLRETWIDYQELTESTLGEDTWARFGAIQKRWALASDSDLAKKMELWKQMRQIQEEYRKWYAEMSLSMDALGTDEQSKRQQERLTFIVNEMERLGDTMRYAEGRAYFTELISMADEFRKKWVSETDAMANSFADGIASALKEARGIADFATRLSKQISDVFSQTGQEWLRSFVRENMGGTGGFFSKTLRQREKYQGEIPTEDLQRSALGAISKFQPLKGFEVPKLLVDPFKKAMDDAAAALQSGPMQAFAEMAGLSTSLSQFGISLQEDIDALLRHTMALQGVQMTSPSAANAAAWAFQNGVGAPKPLFWGVGGQPGMDAGAYGGAAIPAIMAGSLAQESIHQESIRRSQQEKVQGVETSVQRAQLPTGGSFAKSKWAQGITSALGLYGSYQQGDMLGGAFAGDALAGLLGFAGPYGAIAGAGIGLLGKRNRKRPSIQNQAPGVWAPEQSGWASTPWFMDWNAYAGLRGYGNPAIPRPGTFTPMAGYQPTGGGGSLTISPTINVNYQGTGDIGVDGKALAGMVMAHINAESQRNFASGLRLRNS